MRTPRPLQSISSFSTPPLQQSITTRLYFVCRQKSLTRTQPDRYVYRRQTLIFANIKSVSSPDLGKLDPVCISIMKHISKTRLLKTIKDDVEMQFTNDLLCVQSLCSPGIIQVCSSYNVDFLAGNNVPVSFLLQAKMDLMSYSACLDNAEQITGQSNANLQTAILNRTMICAGSGPTDINSNICNVSN